MFRDSVAVVVVVRTHQRAIPLAMITMRKSFMGFLFFPMMTVELRLAARRNSAIIGVQICSLLFIQTAGQNLQGKYNDVVDVNTAFEITLSRCRFISWLAEVFKTKGRRMNIYSAIRKAKLLV